MAIDLGNDPGGTPPTPAEKLQIRSAIGVGTTDAPTFLAQTLTGQSLTGTQATSLVDLSATWNTSGTPTAIKLNVVETGINSNAASKLLDLQVSGVSKASISKSGVVTTWGGTYNTPSFMLGALGGVATNGSNIYLFNTATSYAIGLSSAGALMFGVDADTLLFRDAAGILAQRNGTSAQAFRVYDTYDTAGTNYERGTFGFPVGTNTLRIGTEQAGTGAAQPIEFVVGGTRRGGFSSAGVVDFGVVNVNGNQLNLAAATSINWSGSGGTAFSYIYNTGSGKIQLGDHTGAGNPLLQLGGTTAAFPAIKRNGTGIHIVLADDSTFAPLSAAGITGASFLCSALGGNGFSTTGGGFIIHTAANKLRLSGSADTTGGSLLLDTADVIQVRNLTNTAAGFIQGKLRTETAYTATVVTPTGFLTLYDSTGTAYRVPCVV